MLKNQHYLILEKYSNLLTAQRTLYSISLLKFKGMIKYHIVINSSSYYYMANHKYKILIVAPAWVGDLVMSQTLYKELMRHYDDNVTIDVFASDFLLPLLKRMPEINEVIINPFQHKELNLLGRIKLGLSLCKHKYNEVIILPNSLKSALMPFFTRIKKRTGFVGESRCILLNNIFKLDKIKLPLMIDRFCALADNGKKVENIQFPGLTLDSTNQTLLQNKFGIESNKSLIAFCPGAEYGEAKRWGPKYFARLADLIDKNLYQIVILGSNKDLDVSMEIIQASKNSIINLCGKTNLADAVDILGMAKYTVTNDSGLMHIAASVNSHVIAIYGSTSEEFTPPLCKNKDIVKIRLECSPCFQRTCKFGHYNCLNLITPETIFAKIKS